MPSEVDPKKPIPVVKWAGGKRQLQERILESIATDFDKTESTYFEPFFGGGAILFALGAEKAFCSDINQGLVNVYNQIRSQPASVMAESKRIETKYNALNLESQSNFYYQERESYNADVREGVEQAARFLFLNKAGFNGIYRENAKGGFNVPFGKRHQIKLFDEQNIERVSYALAKVEIRLQDYSLTPKKAVAGDLVYFDPPYVPLSATSAFTGYTSEGFGPSDQIKLRDLFVDLHNRGVKVATSNSSAKAVEELYEGFTFRELTASRAISASADGRKPVTEFLITNF